LLQVPRWSAFLILSTTYIWDRDRWSKDDTHVS
jgi:hypothetical protein